MSDYGNLDTKNSGRKYAYSRGVLVLKGGGNANQLGIYQLSLYTASTATFHLRSLRTGLPHPNAALPTLLHVGGGRSDLKRGFLPIRFEIIGRRIVHMIPRSVSHSILNVWDWVSGRIITSTRIHGSFVFLSEDVFIVANPVGYGLKQPSLELYTCDDIPLGAQARFVGAFNLPASMSEDMQIRQAEFSSSPQPTVWRSDLAIAPPPLIYDLCPASHYLSLNVWFDIDSNRSFGTLFIRSSSFLALANNLVPSLNNNNLNVPWSKWNSVACWVGPQHLDAPTEYGPSTFGHLFAFVHAEEQTGSWWVEVYDLRTATTVAALNPRPRKASRLPRDQKVEPFLNSPPKPMQIPSVVKSFAIPFKTIPWEERPHEIRNGASLEEIIIDDDHVVILQMPLSDAQPSIYVHPL
ncbi:hypothetical protein B0J17DRAFT_677689 [Rhizoctonia solani]|nr:hypothetical protein B0J17DRAFT_677689 [Rhizoctonia solani]